MAWCFVLATSTALTSAALVAQDYPRLSPYPAIRWTPVERPEVRVEGTWYELLAIDDLTIDELLAFCRERYGARCERRFSEDLVQVLTESGRPPGDEVALRLRGVETGEVVVLDAVRMTREHRSAVVEYRRRLATPDTLSAAQVGEDLAFFERLLETIFSYRRLGDPPYVEALAALRARARDDTPVEALRSQLTRVLGLFVDGHARIIGGPPAQGPFMPFLIQATGDGFVAFLPDRSGLVDPDHPYVVSLDGRPLSYWLEVVRPWVPQGSPQMIVRRSLGLLRPWPSLRVWVGLAMEDAIEVELGSEMGTSTRVVSLPLADTPPLYGVWPDRPSQVFADSIGYLRLDDMDEDAVAAVHEWMPRFADTSGLIIDVRGNNGGTRDALVALAGYLLEPGEAYVANVGVYRASGVFDEDHLTERAMYPAEAAIWSTAEREAIARFAVDFRPEWQPPADEFSEWHYFVLSKAGADTRPTYRQPVALLVDPVCFSATDILLAALKGRPNVTLFGEPSSGGSARAMGVPLPNSQLQVVLGSMVSFQPSGWLYDTRGVHPDVLIRPTPSSLVERGDDPVLAAAIADLRKAGRR